ncbi:hypothetical protein K2W90_01845 [Candidatus Babeliales bacterium]|nr:hypothetical protein [Candidatus Babeliales bacterium]
MKQQLWILNSSLLATFFAILVIAKLLKVEPPRVRMRRSFAEKIEKKKETLPASSWEKIYQNDVFKTYVAKEFKPEKVSLVTPIPEPTSPEVKPAPEPKKQEFIDALNITLKGIIISSDELKSVVMIEDETQKEGLYHLGDKVKDAQIIKISRNRVVLLRANGQQEVFFLRKDDPELELDAQGMDKWQYVVKKIDDTTYHVDPHNFKQAIDSLGNFIERASIVGTAYQKNVPIGIRVGALEKDELGHALGLQSYDIVLAINDMNTADVKNRIKIYDTITAMKLNSEFTVKLKRKEEDLVYTYKLSTISKAKKKIFTGKKPDEEGKKKEEAEKLKMSKTQERENLIREFRKRHPQNDQRSAIAKIRQRLLENLRERLKNTRTRAQDRPNDRTRGNNQAPSNNGPVKQQSAQAQSESTKQQTAPSAPAQQATTQKKK